MSLDQAAQILQLQQALLHLQQQQPQQVQAAVEAALAAPGLGVAAAGPPVRVERPRLAPPPKYAGTLGSALDEWERDMNAQFRYYGAAFPDDPSKIVLATSCLQGAALTWWDSDPLHQHIHTWAGFIAAMRARFRPMQASTVARMQLLSMQQDRGQSVTDFINKFQQVMTQIDNMSEEDKVLQFERALYRPLANKVFEKKPATLAAAFEAAVTADGLFNGLSRLSGAGRYTSSSFSSSSGSGGHSSGGSTAMDLSNVSYGPGVEEDDGYTSSGEPPGGASAVHAGNLDALVEARVSAILSRRLPPRSGGAGRGDFSSSKRRGGKQRDGYVAGLSKEVVDARRKADQCIACGAMGHWKNECPKNNKTDKPKQQQGKE